MSVTYVGNSDWRTISEEEGHEETAFDTLRITRRGKYTGVASEKALWPKGTTASAFGYPFMGLRSKRVSSGGGNFSTIDLYFEGFLTTDMGRGYIDRTDDISLQSASLSDSEGEPITVQAQYYAQTNTTRWISNSIFAPQSPKFPIVLASTVDTSVLFDFFPANFKSPLEARSVGRLISFQRSEIAPNVWAVVETWMNRIEAAE